MWDQCYRSHLLLASLRDRCQPRGCQSPPKAWCLLFIFLIKIQPYSQYGRFHLPGAFWKCLGWLSVVTMVGIGHYKYLEGWVHAIERTTSGHTEMPPVLAGVPESLWTLKWMKNSFINSIFPLNTKLFFSLNLHGSLQVWDWMTNLTLFYWELDQQSFTIPRNSTTGGDATQSIRAHNKIQPYQLASVGVVVILGISASICLFLMASVFTVKQLHIELHIILCKLLPFHLLYNTVRALY